VSPRACTVCTHPELEAINHDLVEGIPNRRIASHHDVTERAVRNHKSGHLPAALVKAQEAQEVAVADDLLDQVRALQERALVILNKAEETGELRTALGAIREARGNLELLAKLLGELDERPQVNILIAPEVRHVIVQALQTYPEARLSVANALAEIEEAAS
jgi:hypothetical protein